MLKHQEETPKNTGVAAIPHEEAETSLTDLPDDLIQVISTFLPARDMGRLAGASKSLNQLFPSELVQQRAAKELMGYVLNPTEENLKKGKAMYTANPKLLFIETQGYEPASGIEEYKNEKEQKQIRAVHRKVIGTPFGAALGTGDSTLYNDMAGVLDKLEYKDESGKVIKTGVQRALEEIVAKFPNGFDYPPCDDKFNAQIQAIVDAIRQDLSLINHIDTPDKATQALIAQFRNEFLPKDITQGHHFNLNYLIKALATYNRNWEHWNENQRALFWRQVIGYLERLVPVVDAQAFCQGFFKLRYEEEPQTRSLSVHNYRSNSTIPYFDGFNSDLVGLGFDYAIDFYTTLGEAWCHSRGVARVPADALVKRLCGAKTSDLENLQRGLEEQVWTLLNNGPG